MLSADSSVMCALDAPASRRFYVHAASFGFLVAAQPSVFGEVAHAFAMSGASRALDQAVEDWAMLLPSEAGASLAAGARTLHNQAADALRTAFQCIVHLVPPRFGATELLLGPNEQINAWCYEDGYLTYATDDNAAAIMYAETGSLRELRSQIRRSPDSDPSLQMISGQSLFLFDQRTGTGPGTALFYKKQSARLLRNFRGIAPVSEFHDPELVRAIEESVGSSAAAFDGDDLSDTCLRRGNLMVNTLLHNVPSTPSAYTATEHSDPSGAADRTGELAATR